MPHQYTTSLAGCRSPLGCHILYTQFRIKFLFPEKKLFMDVLLCLQNIHKQDRYAYIIIYNMDSAPDFIMNPETEKRMVTGEFMSGYLILMTSAQRVV